MSFVTIAVGVGTAAVGLYTASKNRSAANKAADDVAKNQLNIENVMKQARDNSALNLKTSLDLERQYQPGTAQLRLTADQGLKDLASGNTAGLRARDSLLGQLGSANPLLQAASDKLMAQLNLGGKLDPETQAAAARAALEHGGSSGISGSGAARGLVARDLGLTSLNLLNSRTSAALQGGQTMSQDLYNRANLAMNAAGQDSGNSLNIAQLIDRRALPDPGLSSSALANLLVGQNNAQNQNIATRLGIQTANNNAVGSTVTGLLGTLGGIAGGGSSFSGMLGSMGGGAGGGNTAVNAGANYFGNGTFTSSSSTGTPMNWSASGPPCWVAREVYGRHNPKWLQFRQWLLEDAPVWLLRLYIKYGECFASFISDKPRVKEIIRRWMDARVANKFLNVA
jgi:hypothetical protein